MYYDVVVVADVCNDTQGESTVCYIYIYVHVDWQKYSQSTARCVML